MEGMLFPDTYEIDEDTDERALRAPARHPARLQPRRARRRGPGGRARRQPVPDRRHRLADRGGGPGAGRPGQDRPGHLQPARAGHPARHRRHVALRGRDPGPQPGRHRLHLRTRRTTPAGSPACRRRPSPPPAGRRSRPRSPRRPATGSTTCSRTPRATTPSSRRPASSRPPSRSASARTSAADDPPGRVRRDPARRGDRLAGPPLALAPHPQRRVRGGRARLVYLALPVPARPARRRAWRAWAPSASTACR